MTRTSAARNKMVRIKFIVMNISRNKPCAVPMPIPSETKNRRGWWPGSSPLVTAAAAMLPMICAVTVKTALYDTATSVCRSSIR